MIPDYVKANLESLARAFTHNDAALLECKDPTTGETVYAICAVEKHGEEYTMTPYARMFNGDPYAQLIPPVLGDNPIDLNHAYE